MASQVEIVNRALLKLGGSPVTSLTDNSPSARVMSGLWDSVRKSELCKRFWNFALARSSLPALADAPAWGYGYAYQLPVDFLKIMQVNDYFQVYGTSEYRNMDDSPYAIEGQNILTDYSAPLKIRYVADITDPGLFDPLFDEVMASKLAYEGCYAIMQSRDGQRMADQDYKQALSAASISNAIAKPPQGLIDDSWMMSRL